VQSEYIDGDLSDWFNAVVGVLQDCVLSPLLFSIFLEIIMCIALEEEDAGAWINEVKLSELRFADDIVLFAESKDKEVCRQSSLKSV